MPTIHNDTAKRDILDSDSSVDRATVSVIYLTWDVSIPGAKRQRAVSRGI